MLSRRDLLTGLAAAGVLGVGAGVLGGCTVPGPVGGRSSYCMDRASLPQFRRINDTPVHYEIDGSPQAFHYDRGFHGQLESWLADWVDTSGLSTPTRIDSYGAWTNGRPRCDSWHNSGRAFDLARLGVDGRTQISCREDLWVGESTANQIGLRRGYWALAAHLHIHFAYVLTYLYDAQHRNHIHLDNGRSGSGLSTFGSGSRVQVQAVQATARYLWDEPVELTGRWDAVTRDASRQVLGTLGRSGGLESSDNWHAYLRACARRGATA